MKRGVRFLMWTIVGIIAIAAFGFVTQLLWNWIVPTVFNGPVITFWQTLGILVLSKILFSGFGHKGHRHHYGYPRWKYRLHEKFSGMTPEEREAFKKKLRDKWCPSDTWSQESKEEKKAD